MEIAYFLSDRRSTTAGGVAVGWRILLYLYREDIVVFGVEVQESIKKFSTRMHAQHEDANTMTRRTTPDPPYTQQQTF